MPTKRTRELVIIIFLMGYKALAAMANSLALGNFFIVMIHDTVQNHQCFLSYRQIIAEV